MKMIDGTLTDLEAVKRSITGVKLDDEATSPKTDIERYLTNECGYRKRNDATFIHDIPVIPITIEKRHFAYQDTNMFLLEENIKWLSVNVVMHNSVQGDHVSGVVEYLGSDEENIYAVIRMFTQRLIAVSDFEFKYDFTVMKHELSTKGVGDMRRSIVVGFKDDIANLKKAQRS